MEAKIKQLVREQIKSKINSEKMSSAEIEMISQKILTAVMALAYNRCDVQSAANDLFEIPTQCLGETLQDIKDVLEVVSCKFPNEIHAFEAYLNNKDFADEDTVLTLVANELEIEIDEFDDPDEFNWDQFDLDEDFEDDYDATIEEDDPNEVYSYIIEEVIEKLSLEEEENELDYDILNNLVYEIMIGLNEGTNPEIVVEEIRSKFLLSGIEPEEGELESLMEGIQSQCGQHLLAMRIAQQSFEDGETSETVMPKIMQIID